MSLVAGYGSESEEEGAAPVSVPRPVVPAPPKPTLSSVAAGTNQKKRKKPKKSSVLISILPPEIQAALARGASLGDSDDEDTDKHEMERVKRLREQAAAAKAQAAYGADKSGLFALLPKPKAEQEIESMLNKQAAQQATASAKAKEAAKAAPIKATAESSSEDEEDEEDSSQEDAGEKPEEPPQVEEGKDGNGGSNGAVKGPVAVSFEKEEEEEEDDEEGGLHPSLFQSAVAPPPSAPVRPFSTSLPTIPRPVVRLAPAISAAPPVATPAQHSQPPPMDATSAGSYAYGGGYAAPQDQPPQYAHDPASAYYHQQQQQQYWSAQGYDSQQAYQQGMLAQQQQAAYAAQMDYAAPTEEEEDDSEGGANKGRRRKRELQRALAAGKLDVLDKVGSQVKEVEAYQEAWNPFQHGAVTQTEKPKVASVVYNPKTGETVQTYDASKTHKRKHQITTLAQQAVERELEILEGKHKGMLTKAQTQSKYGW